MRWLLAALAVCVVVSTISFLSPPKVRIVAECLSHLVNSVDPTAQQWEFDSVPVAGLTEDERVRLSSELMKVGIELSEEPLEHRIVLMRLYRASTSKYVVVAGAYAPPWGGQEVEFTVSLFKGWRVVRRLTLRQS